jgi:hypothetical protein
MMIKYDSPSSSGSGGNKGSSAQFLNYMDKEKSQEEWFGLRSNHVEKEKVLHRIDEDKKGIGKEEAKFYTGSINLTEDEFKAMGSTDAERERNLKQWVKEEFTQGTADNFVKTNSKGEAVKIEADNLKIFYKLERERHYHGTDPEVKRGEKKSGELKEGFQTHVHFIQAKKTADRKYKVSPTTNNTKEFNRVKLFEQMEKKFDQKFSYNRRLEDTFEYKNTLSHGPAQEKINAIKQAVFEGISRDRVNHPIKEKKQPTEYERLMEKAKQRITDIEEKRSPSQEKGKGLKM